MFNKILSSSGATYNQNSLTYHGNSTTITTSGGSNILYHTNQAKTKSITIPGTDILVRDDWQNNLCTWYIKKYGLEGMLEFIEENPIYLKFLDRSFSDYLRDMKKIVDRNKKIEQLIG